METAKPNLREQGITIMECLVAIVVITIVIAAITPPLLIAMATRVQNYRAEQAMKLAQGEMDRVRLLVEGGLSADSDWTNKLPPPGTTYKITDVAAPTSSKSTPPTCPLPSSDQPTSYCGQDINGDGQWDLGVQTFRTPAFATPGNPAPNPQPIAFVMGVRVYTRAALESGQPLETQPRGLSLTSGQSLTAPLVSLSSPVVRSNLNISIETYCNLYMNMGYKAPSGGCPQ